MLNAVSLDDISLNFGEVNISLTLNYKNSANSHIFQQKRFIPTVTLSLHCLKLLLLVLDHIFGHSVEKITQESTNLILMFIINGHTHRYQHPNTQKTHKS